jgi:hypothetical protein
MLVEVRPIDRQKWHGKKGKEAFGQAQTIEVLYDSQTGQYATGLTPEDAEKYGKILGQDLSPIFDPNKPHPFWCSQAARIKLPIHTLMLDTDRPSDFVKVANLKASKFVANSYDEWQKGMFPEATHIIFSEEDEVAIKASKSEKRDACVTLKVNMNKEDKINLITILGESNTSARGKSDNFVNVEIDKIIDSKPDEFIRHANMDKTKLYVRAAVLEAIHKNILTKEGTAVYYLGDKLGSSVDDAVAYFEDPQNQQLKIRILEQLTK